MRSSFSLKMKSFVKTSFTSKKSKFYLNNDKNEKKIFFFAFFLSRALRQRNYFKGDATNLATLVLQNQFLFWNRIGYSPGAKRKLTTKTTRTKKSSNWTETLVSKNWNKPCQYELYFIFLVWVFSLKKKSWFFYRVWSKHIAR